MGALQVLVAAARYIKNPRRLSDKPRRADRRSSPVGRPSPHGLQNTHREGRSAVARFTPSWGRYSEIAVLRYVSLFSGSKIQILLYSIKGILNMLEYANVPRFIPQTSL